MKTLELKHVAPYLAYGLKGITYGYNKDKRISELQGVSFDSFVYEPELFIETKLTNITSRRRISISNFKPILRPLSQLTQEIEHNGGKFVPIVELLKIKNKTWFKEHENTRYQEIDFNDSYNISSACFAYMATKNIEIWKHDLKNQPYWIIEKLFEWHFDVFGLIEQKLAIEKL